MFKKEKVQEDEAKDQEETAYEDSWYRSLKALANRKPEADEEVEAPED